METLSAYARNTYSQRGEDGIIARILDLIGPIPKWCAEFGAWDGIHLSNTHALMEQGWSGVFIEGSPERFKELKKTYSGNPKAYPICAFVGFQPLTDLDSLLATTPIPKDFGILSIDIDGNDYHVWEASCLYRSSLVGVSDNSVETLFADRSSLMDAFQLYDGTLVFTGKRKLFWHGIDLDGFQPIPKFFRIFPANMGNVRAVLFKIWRRLCNWRSRRNEVPR